MLYLHLIYFKTTTKGEANKIEGDAEREGQECCPDLTQEHAESINSFSGIKCLQNNLEE